MGSTNNGCSGQFSLFLTLFFTMWQLKKNRNRANHKQKKRAPDTALTFKCTATRCAHASVKFSTAPAVSHRKNKLDMVHE